MCMGLEQLARARSSLRVVSGQSRCLSTHLQLRSGHNRWSKIKHDKGKEDALKSKARSILSNEIILASKYGGSDPILNSRLAFAIANAKKGQLSKSSIESAIARGQGRSASGAPLENITVEAMLPHGVAAIIEYQTESKARVLQEIRNLITRNGGSITPTGFLFEKTGKIIFDRQDGINVDDILEEAIDAGALDITDEVDGLVVVTSPTEVTAVARRLQERLKLQLQKLEVVYMAKQDSLVSLNQEQEEELQNTLDRIEEESSLQNIYINGT